MTTIPEKFRDRLAIDLTIGPDPVVKGTEITVRRVVAHIADGWSRVDLFCMYRIDAEDIRACIDYTSEQDAKLGQNR